MSDWKKHTVYCRTCNHWCTDLIHTYCEAGAHGSLVMIDLDSFRLGCTKCGYTWDLEDNTFTCAYGHQQKTQYLDSALTIQAGDQVIASDGDYVYVLTRSGTVVVGRRSFPYDSYEYA